MAAKPNGRRDLVLAVAFFALFLSSSIAVALFHRQEWRAKHVVTREEAIAFADRLEQICKARDIPAMRSIMHDQAVVRCNIGTTGVVQMTREDYLSSLQYPFWRSFWRQSYNHRIDEVEIIKTNHTTRLTLSCVVTNHTSSYTWTKLEYRKFITLAKYDGTILIAARDTEEKRRTFGKRDVYDRLSDTVSAAEKATNGFWYVMLYNVETNEAGLCTRLVDIKNRHWYLLSAGEEANGIRVVDASMSPDTARIRIGTNDILLSEARARKALGR